MADITVQFFENLAAREQPVLPDKYEGTIRFDLSDHDRTDHWLLTIHRGDVAVSRAETEADSVMYVGHALFDQLATGEEDLIPLLFRGAFAVEGDLFLLTVLRRLLPARPGARHPRDLMANRRRST